MKELLRRMWLSWKTCPSRSNQITKVLKKMIVVDIIKRSFQFRVGFLYCPDCLLEVFHLFYLKSLVLFVKLMFFSIPLLDFALDHYDILLFDLLPHLPHRNF